MRARLYWIWVAASLVCGGCAYTNVVPVDPHDQITQGFRVYDSKPILIVGQSLEIKFVPNYSKAYAVQFGAFLSKNDFSIQVDNGVVKQLDSKLDTTGIIELLKTVVEKTLPTVVGAPSGSGGIQTVTSVQIYDFVFDDEGNLIALRRVKFIGGAPRLPTPPSNAKPGQK